MGIGNFEGIHSCQHRTRKIVARCVGDEVALAVTGIVECNRAAALAELGYLRRPDAFVGTDTVKENDRCSRTVAGLLDANPSDRCCNDPHNTMMTSVVAFASPSHSTSVAVR